MSLFQNHWFTYNEPMSVESVTQAVSNLALEFGDDNARSGAMVCMQICFLWRKKFQYLCFNWNTTKATAHFFVQSRPFGVALLFGGFDEKGPQL